MKSAEQRARDLLEQCGVEEAQSFSAGDVVSLANLIADYDRLLMTSDLSNITINGEHQTWQQLYEREAAERRRLQRYQTMLSDLSRNEHGRHEGDADAFDPDGWSKGNPHLKTGDVIGYSLGGSWKYIVPPPQHRGNINHWQVRNG